MKKDDTNCLNPEQLIAYQLVCSKRSFFLTGKAGTGKTTFIKYIQEKMGDNNFVMVAPTGLAAITVGGQTIHSFFGLPFDPIAPYSNFDIFNINYEKQLLLSITDTIIIDEVSMVKCDMIDAIDSILRHIMKSSRPFGGKQVIFTGDLYQLDPVVNLDDEGISKFYWYHYNTDKPYFFKAKVFQSYQLPCVEFTTVYRQTDKDFLKMLEHIRLGQYIGDETDFINRTAGAKMQMPTTEKKGGIKDLILTPFNKKSDDINERELANIKEPALTYTGKLEGDFNRRNFPAPYELVLKKGAQVMFCKNDKEHRWVNGTIGIVSELSDDSISVLIEDKQVTVSIEAWNAIKYVFNEQNHKLEKQVIGTYKQYPLKLAWAITIHKSQGLTFDHVTLDPNGIFAAGQLYVALSRVRSLEGLKLSNRIYSRYFFRKYDIDMFMQKYGNLEDIKNGISLYQPALEAISESDYDKAASHLLSNMFQAAKNGNMSRAWYCACQMLSILHNLNIFTAPKETTLISGEDEQTLLINSIISICNKNYTVAAALADRGISLNNYTDFHYLKCIALYLNNNYDASSLAQEEWKKKLKEYNKVIDSRFYFISAQTNKALQQPYISAIQHIIRHTPHYVTPLLFLKQSMNAEHLKLESAEDNILIDLFNQPESDKEFLSALNSSSKKERATLIHAILEYPYE